MRCPSCRAKISPDALSCPACGHLLVAPDRVVDGTVVASSVSEPAPIYDAETTTTSVSGARPNRLTRQRPRSTVISSLARFAQARRKQEDCVSTPTSEPERARMASG